MPPPSEVPERRSTIAACEEVPSAASRSEEESWKVTADGAVQHGNAWLWLEVGSKCLLFAIVPRPGGWDPETQFHGPRYPSATALGRPSFAACEVDPKRPSGMSSSRSK